MHKNNFLYFFVCLGAFALPLSKGVAVGSMALIGLTGLFNLLAKKERYRPHTLLLIAILIWWAHKYSGLLWTDDFALAEDELKNIWYFLVVPTMGYYLTQEKIKGVLWAYAIGTLCVVSQCYLIAAGILPTKGQPGFEPYQHIDYSILISIGWLCLLWLRSMEPHNTKTARLLEVALLAVIINIFGFQNGRTGQAGLIGAVLCLPLLIYSKKSPLKAVFALMAVCVGLGILFSTVPFFKHRWSSVYSDIELGIKEQNYFTNQGGRIGMWVTAKEIVSRSPWLGTGTGDTEKVLAEVAHEKYSPRVAKRLISLGHFHNAYVQALVQLGFPGLITLLFMLSALWYVQGKTKQQAWLRAITLLLFIAMMTEPFILKSRGRIAFVLLMGVSLVLARTDTYKEVTSK